MIAVVLAAGRGTRLAETAGNVPKPLVPVAGVPVIDRILDTLAGDGFDEVLVVTGHRADEVEAHLAGRAPVGFARQDEPLGTAHALLTAQDAIGHSPFLVAWSDVIVESGTYRQVADAATGFEGAVAVNEVDDLSSGGAVFFETGVVTGVVEKPGRGAGWNLTGVLALEHQVWRYVETVERSVRGEYELPEAIDAWVRGGAKVGVVPVEGWIFEVGSPGGLAAANAYLSRETRSR